jgi:hypothetical protein
MKKVVLSFLAINFGMTASAMAGAKIPNCFNFPKASNNGRYAVAVPDAGSMSAGKVQELLADSKVFNLDAPYHSRTMRETDITMTTVENEKVGPLLRQAMAEQTLAQLPSDVTITCNAELSVAQ